MRRVAAVVPVTVLLHGLGLGARKKKRGTRPIKPRTAAQLDALHDAGADLTTHLDLAQARRPGRVTQRVNVDFPQALLKAIDREAKRIGVTRRSRFAFARAGVAGASQPGQADGRVLTRLCRPGATRVEGGSDCGAEGE